MKCLSHWLESIKTIFLFVNFNVVRTCFTSVFFSSLPFNRTHRNDSELELLVSSFLFWSKQNEKEDAKMRRLHENQKHADGAKCREETLQWTKPICHTLRARKVTENNRRTMQSEKTWVDESGALRKPQNDFENQEQGNVIRKKVCDYLQTFAKLYRSSWVWTFFFSVFRCSLILISVFSWIANLRSCQRELHTVQYQTETISVFNFPLVV